MEIKICKRMKSTFQGGKIMKVKCLNCGHEFETTEIKEDDLGRYCICEECGASFDVDVDEIIEGK